MPAKIRRRIVRETTARDPIKGEPLILEIEIGGALLSVRQKGRRTRYPVPLVEIFRIGVKIAQQAYLTERKKERERKRRERTP